MTDRKSIEVQSHYLISEKASTRATAYGMSNKIISFGDTTVIAWLDFMADIKIRAYNRKSEEWGEGVFLGSGMSNHTGPAITMDSRGIFHTVYGPHHGPFVYRHTRNPYDITEWSQPIEFGEMATYPSLICGPDDTLYLTYRSSSDTRNWRIHFHKKPKEGKWSEPLALMDPDFPGYIWSGHSLAMSPNGDLHLAFNIYLDDEQPKGSKHYGYLRSADGGNTWTNDRGQPMELPVTPQSACYIRQDPTMDARVKSNVIGPDGNPWFVCIHFERSPRTVEINHWTGETWEMIDLLPHLQEEYPGREIVDASITFDAKGRFYAVVTSGEEATTGLNFWAQPSQELFLMVSEDGGKTFDIQWISQEDPEHPNWLASLERPYTNNPIQGIPTLIYTHKGPGKGVDGGPPSQAFFIELTEVEPEDKPRYERSRHDRMKTSRIRRAPLLKRESKN